MSDRQELQTASQTPQTSQTQQEQPPAQRSNTERERALTPRVDVLEDDTGITLLADLPGVPKDQLELKVEGDTLQIEAPITPHLPERLQPVYAEVRLGRYRRAFTLSRELDASRIDASLKDGVLNLRIPKHAHAQPRRIEVRVG